MATESDCMMYSIRTYVCTYCISIYAFDQNERLKTQALEQELDGARDDFKVRMYVRMYALNMRMYVHIIRPYNLPSLIVKGS